MGRNNFI